MQINPEETLRIENIVASARIADHLDLQLVFTQIKGADFNKKRFPGVVIRMQDPKVAALVFASGKVVLTGARTADDIATGLALLGDQLRSLGIDIPIKVSYKIQNIVTSANLGTRINLDRIAMGLSLEKVEYEPEQFPGLIYRLDDPKVVTLLFGSGKTIITGGKNLDDARKALRRIISDLKGIGQG